MRIEQLLADFIHSAGFGICHQAASRSFSAAGVQFPVCARCTGIYTGFIFGLVALFWVYRSKQRIGRLSWWYIGFAIGAVSFMGIDGVSSYLGVRETTNLFRVVTGVLFGGAMAPITYLILVESLARHRTGEAILDRPATLMVWATSLVVGVAFVYASLWLGIVAPLTHTLFIVGTFGLVVSALVGLHPRYERSVEQLHQALEPVLIGLFGGGFLVAGCALLRYVLRW